MRAVIAAAMLLSGCCKPKIVEVPTPVVVEHMPAASCVSPALLEDPPEPPSVDTSGPISDGSCPDPYLCLTPADAAALVLYISAADEWISSIVETCKKETP